jgi:hypothetical protein
MASTQGKPILDEATFQRLLAAAYTMQRHNGSPLVKGSRAVPAPPNGSVIPPETAYQLFALASRLDALTRQEIPTDSEWRTRLPVAVAREMLAKGRLAGADDTEVSGKAVLKQTSSESSEPKSPAESSVTSGANSFRDRIVRRLTRSQELFWKAATIFGIAAVSALLLGASIYRLTSLPTGLALPSEGVEQQRTRRIVKPSKSHRNQIVKPGRIGSTLSREADVVAKDTVIRYSAAGLPVPVQKKASGPMPVRALASAPKTTVKPSHTPSTDGSVADLVAEDTIIRYNTRSSLDGAQTQKRP